MEYLLEYATTRPVTAASEAAIPPSNYGPVTILRWIHPMVTDTRPARDTNLLLNGAEARLPEFPTSQQRAVE